jgi:putative MFS transporter
MGFLELNRKQWFIFLAVFFGWALDAYASGLISFSLTPMANELSLGTADKSAILVAWPAGMLVGALLLGYLADYLGRRPIIIGALGLMGVFGGLAAFVSSTPEILVLRFLGGMGASAYMAVGSTLLTEYMPAKQRGRAVAIAESSWSVGWVIASLVSFLVVPQMGWRVSMASSFSTLLAIPVALVLVPESAMFLDSKGKGDLSRKLRDEYGLTETEKKQTTKVGISDLFGSKYRKATSMLWVHWFAIALAYWGTFLWLPTLLQTKGLSLTSSLFNSVLITLAQIPGYVSGALLIEKTGRKITLSVYMGGAGLASYMLAHAVTQQDAMLWAILFSFFNLGAWGVTYAYTPELYPTAIRATGAGWANAVGRIGSIVGPYFLGALLAYGNQETAFLAFSIVQLISAAVIIVAARETMGKDLEA